MLARIVGIACYTALAALILTFIFSNGQAVTLQLLPFSTSAELPLYVALCALFALGLLIGLLHSMFLWLRMQRKLRRANRTIAQLERDIATRPTAPTA